MRSIRGGHCLDSIDTHLVVDHLHHLGLRHHHRAGVHPQEDAVLDDDSAGGLHDHTVWGQVTEGGGVKQKCFNIVHADLNNDND